MAVRSWFRARGSSQPASTSETFKTAALILYALQTASMNLSRTSLEPALPTQVVIDRESVANRPIGASAWSRVEGREYDDLSRDDPNEQSDRKQPADSERLQ
jgi:hypothetical protein